MTESVRNLDVISRVHRVSLALTHIRLGVPPEIARYCHPKPPMPNENVNTLNTAWYFMAFSSIPFRKWCALPVNLSLEDRARSRRSWVAAMPSGRPAGFFAFRCLAPTEIWSYRLPRDSFNLLVLYYNVVALVVALSWARLVRVTKLVQVASAALPQPEWASLAVASWCESLP